MSAIRRKRRKLVKLYQSWYDREPQVISRRVWNARCQFLMRAQFEAWIIGEHLLGLVLRGNWESGSTRDYR